MEANGHPYEVGTEVDVLWDHPEIEDLLYSIHLEDETEKRFPGPYRVAWSDPSAVQNYKGWPGYYEYRTEGEGRLPAVLIQGRSGRRWWLLLDMVRRKTYPHTLLLGPVNNEGQAV
jgi:hypothetical protein